MPLPLEIKLGDDIHVLVTVRLSIKLRGVVSTYTQRRIVLVTCGLQRLLKLSASPQMVSRGLAKCGPLKELIAGQYATLFCLSLCRPECNGARSRYLLTTVLTNKGPLPISVLFWARRSGPPRYWPCGRQGSSRHPSLHPLATKNQYRDMQSCSFFWEQESAVKVEECLRLSIWVIEE